MRKTKKISISAILSALSVVLLYLGSVLEVLDLSAAALASIAIVFAQIELKNPYPYLIYFTVSLLAVLLLPSKFSAMVYVFFGGIYPMIKEFAERRPGVSCLLIKAAGFLVLMLIAALALVYIFLLPKAELFSTYYIAVFLLCCVTFVLYDYALTVLISLYFRKLRKKIQRYLR